MKRIPKALYPPTCGGAITLIGITAIDLWPENFRPIVMLVCLVSIFVGWAFTERFGG